MTKATRIARQSVFFSIWRVEVGEHEGVRLPIVATLNYLFFQSTQSFIWFYLSHLSRVCPICLTRMPESSQIGSELPVSQADDFYLYPGVSRVRPLASAAWSAGLALRGGLSRLPPPAARAISALLQRRIVPRLRHDADPAHLLDWAEEILLRRDAQLLHA